MKKLFFSALIAVAAIGGATAFPVYQGSTYIGDCIDNPQLPECTQGEGIYRESANGPLYTFAELEGTYFQPAE